MKPADLRQKIFEIRGEKVMLDFDLAELYGVQTKRLNEQVKRNSHSFPKDFMFRLTSKEWRILLAQFAMEPLMHTQKRWSQIATTSGKYRGKKYLPLAFTEHGVVMVANILKSKKAVQMSIVVVRAFIRLKKIVTCHDNFQQQLKELRNELYQRIGEHDSQLSAIYDAIEKLLDEQVEPKVRPGRRRIGFKRKGEEDGQSNT
jgi:phage regulator Rha-like protein